MSQPLGERSASNLLGHAYDQAVTLREKKKIPEKIREQVKFTSAF